MTGRQTSSIRAALLSHDAGRGKRYPQELKARITEFAKKRRREGASWAQIAEDVGIAFETLRRWCIAMGETSPAMVPVHVVPDEAERTVSVVSPTGYRIEGVSLRDAVAVLRALG